MLEQIHFLLTYTCNYECDHCFLYCGPHAEGTFTSTEIRQVLEQARTIPSIEWIYFEGGEPFLYYPILQEGLRLASTAGFKTGIVTNCYWATTVEDAKLWLSPLQQLGVHDLSLSNDAFHFTAGAETPADRAARAAAELGMSTGSICIENPSEQPPSGKKGEPVVGSGALLKGRAADTLVSGMPTRPKESFTACIQEELVEPTRLHLDPLGNLHICQGIVIGNVWQQPLAEIISTYSSETHPVCGPLNRGGPLELAKTYGIELDHDCVDECHYCFTVRRRLLSRLPEVLTPPQIYGISE